MDYSFVAPKTRQQLPANRQKGNQRMSNQPLSNYSKSRLRGILLTHWENYHPKLLAELQRDNTLETVLDQLAQQWSDLLYDLVVVQGMDYMGAWEIGVYIFLAPEEADEAGPSSQNRHDDLPETSA